MPVCSGNHEARANVIIGRGPRMESDLTARCQGSPQPFRKLLTCQTSHCALENDTERRMIRFALTCSYSEPESTPLWAEPYDINLTTDSSPQTLPQFSLDEPDLLDIINPLY